MIFQAQTAVRLILRTGLNFNETPAASYKIKYIKPDGTSGEWTAAVLTGSETLGDIFIDFSDLINFDQSGKWTLWAYLTFADTRFGRGRKQIYLVEK